MGATTRTTAAPRRPRTDTSAAAPAGGCEQVDAPEPKPDGGQKAPKAGLDPAKTYDVELRTNCGSFTVRLDQETSPKTAASFVALAKDGFFDGTVFHRIVPDFVIQGGDPTGSGMGGPGYSTRDAPPDDATYTRGVVAMAKTETEPAGHGGQPVLRGHRGRRRPARPTTPSSARWSKGLDVTARDRQARRPPERRRRDAHPDGRDREGHGHRALSAPRPAGQPGPAARSAFMRACLRRPNSVSTPSTAATITSPSSSAPKVPTPPKGSATSLARPNPTATSSTMNATSSRMPARSQRQAGARRAAPPGP